MKYLKIQQILDKYADAINNVEHMSDVTYILHDIFNKEFGSYDLVFTMICFILCRTFKLRLNVEISMPPNTFSTYIVTVSVGDVIAYKTTIGNDIVFVTRGVDNKQKAIELIDHCIKLDLDAIDTISLDDYKIISNSKDILQEIMFNL